MAKRRNKKRSVAKQSAVSRYLRQRAREGYFILTMALSVFMLIALCSYNPNDPSWTYATSLGVAANAAGRVGAWLADVLLYCFGTVAYLFPPLMCYSSWQLYRHRGGEEDDARILPLLVFRCLGFLMVLVAVTGLVGICYHDHPVVPFHPAGILGLTVSSGMVVWFNGLGASCLLVACFFLGVILLTGFSFFQCLEAVGAGSMTAMKILRRFFENMPWRRVWLQINTIVLRWRVSRAERNLDDEECAEAQPLVKREPQLVVEKAAVAPTNEQEQRVEVKKQEVPAQKNVLAFSHPAMQVPEGEVVKHRSVNKNVLPRIDLLDRPKPVVDQARSDSLLHERAIEVEQRLCDFGVSASVTAIHPGPVVTRYELELAAGTKVSRVSNLAKDLARSLSVTSVRIVEVIEGKSVIGIELPNADRKTVFLREVLESKTYTHSRSKLSMAIGKDIAGNAVVVDLAKMPHLLVAGTTGSGKSVSLNAMLLSLLYKSTPQQLRLILIDPKMLELAVYEGIPHLLTPVVTDMKDAAKALRWCVAEMERRYHLMASLGVRNLAGFNAKVIEAIEKRKPLLDPLMDGRQGPAVELEPLPQIVVLADEFADMMVVVGKKVETLIARLAQKARAAGIHLIFATQRPSVDVITGLIKANIPTRIAFQVSSKVDSRTILDQQGAEQLLGNGDMLYLAPGAGIPVRVHGCFVTDEEVHEVVHYLRQASGSDYQSDILEEPVNAPGVKQSDWLNGIDTESGERDPLYDQAVEMVVKSRRVSVSAVQRRFKIGYNRAARIVDSMEDAGVVSGMESNGTREVLVPSRE